MRSKDLLNMSVGQTDLHPAIKRVLVEPLETPAYFQEYKDLQAETLERLKRILNTKQDVHIVLGTGRTGLETGVHNLIGPGDRVVSVENGHWGKFFGSLAENAGATVTYVSAPLGSPPPLDALEAELGRGGVAAVTVVHCETNTGVHNPIQEIARLIARKSPETLLMVDGISAFGGMEVKFDEWGLDFYCGGSQKCLNAPQGCPVVTLSEKALRVAKAKKPRPLHTLMLSSKPSFLMTRCLHAVAGALLEEGLSKVYERHARAAAGLRSGLLAMGLEVMAQRDVASATCTRIVWPTPIAQRLEAERKAGAIDSDCITQTMKERFKVVIAEDRVGTMGHFAQPGYVLATLGALEQTLDALGFRKSTGAGVMAAQREFAQTQSSTP